VGKLSFLLSLLFVFTSTLLSPASGNDDQNLYDYMGFESVFYPQPITDLTAPPLSLKKAIKLQPNTRVKSLTPMIDGSHKFRGDVVANGCAAAIQEPVLCDFGNIDAQQTVVIVGGSHAAHFMDGLLEVFDPRIWKITTVLKRGCRFKDYPNEPPGRYTNDCVIWSAAAFEYIQETQPTAIVMLGTTTATMGRETISKGLRSMVRLASANTENLIVLRDTPRFPKSHAKCLNSKPRKSFADCVFTLNRDFERITTPRFQLSENSNSAIVHLNPYICINFKCPAAVSDILIYRDNDHLTPTFAKQLAPVIAYQIKSQIPEIVLAQPTLEN
jgi:hypothetical protein